MVTKVGPERAMMKHPEAQAGFLVRGSANIDAMLAKGWVILENDRNHLLPERKEQSWTAPASGTKNEGATMPQPPVGDEIPTPETGHKRGAVVGVTDQPKRGPGRPRKVANNNK